MSSPLGPLVFEHHRPDLLDPFVLGEAPDADMAAAQIAVPVPVHAARGAVVIDLSAVGENAKRGSDSAGAGNRDGARRAADRAQLVANRGAVRKRSG